MTITTSTEAAGRARRLRESSRTAHHRAAAGGLTDRIVAGTVTLDEYVALLDQLWHVYDVLELAADLLAADPLAGPFVDPALHRAPAIARDLTALRGRDHRPAPPLPATERYLERLADLAADDAVRFVAHHYTRYLGDLSGGQYLGRRVAEALDLDVDHGVGWYHFDAIDDVDAYKDRYRARLDAMDLDPAADRRLLDEVMVAYALNADLLAALGPS